MKRSALILLALLLAACTKQSLQTTYDKQTTNIESFISAQMKSDPHATLVHNEGSYRVNLHDTLDATLHRTDSLQWGGKVALYYGCFVFSGTAISTGNLVATNTLDKSLVPGLATGLEGVQPLDEGYILFTGKYGYGASEKGTIPARSALAYYFWIENISNEN